MRTNIYKYLLIILSFIISCEIALKVEASIAEPIISFNENPWPETRKKGIKKLLPDALGEAIVDACKVVARENNKDPLADHRGSENAREVAAFLFYKFPMEPNP